MEDYSDYIDLEEIKMRAKQAKCSHKEVIFSKKCKCCGLWWVEEEPEYIKIADYKII